MKTQCDSPRRFHRPSRLAPRAHAPRRSRIGPSLARRRLTPIRRLGGQAAQQPEPVGPTARSPWKLWHHCAQNSLRAPSSAVLDRETMHLAPGRPASHWHQPPCTVYGLPRARQGHRRSRSGTLAPEELSSQKKTWTTPTPPPAIVAQNLACGLSRSQRRSAGAWAPRTCIRRATAQ